MPVFDRPSIEQNKFSKFVFSSMPVFDRPTDRTQRNNIQVVTQHATIFFQNRMHLKLQGLGNWGDMTTPVTPPPQETF